MPRSPEHCFKRPATLPSADMVAEWDQRLKAADKSLMTPVEEEQGVQFGSEDAEDVVFDDEDETNQRIAEIAKAIAREPGNELWKVPADLLELRRAILEQVRDCRKNKYGEPKVGIHTSCVTGDPCVFIQLPDQHPRAETVLHLPTVDIEEFFPTEFANEVAQSANIDVRLKP
ncbi:MAG: hypothetical protein ACD_72C00328G0005 [uncultured bacterium]|nr:MAG: hypothetical protein ACD_72C00328G0005 [uncultured bacterium]